MRVNSNGFKQPSDSYKKLRFGVDQSEHADFRILVVHCVIRACYNYHFVVMDHVWVSDRTESPSSIGTQLTCSLHLGPVKLSQDPFSPT